MSDLPDEAAYSLCQEMLTAAGLMIAAMWGHITWMHRSLTKRIDKEKKRTDPTP